MSSIKQILCPIDYSPTSDRAVTVAMDLAKQLGASVLFVHVWEPPTYWFPEQAILFPGDVVAQLAKDAEQRVEALVSTHRGAGVPVEGLTVAGYPPDEIVRLAHDRHADLIVMGTHGRRGFAHAFMGSVAERVVRTSRVAVLTVPPDRAAAQDVTAPRTVAMRPPG